MKKTFKNLLSNPWVFFCYAWALTFVVYLPAAKAGFVGDFYKDWLTVIQQQPFWDYINRPGTATLYQFTQFITYVIYNIIGASRLGWHFVHVTMHVTTALLLFVFVKKLLEHIQISFARGIAFAVSTLFLISPYNSEVVVHEPCLHYTFGFCLLLLPLIWVQQFLVSGNKKYLLWCSLLYLPATFSLEIFYLTPVLCGLLWWWYYRYTPYVQKFRIVLFWCLFPMLASFLLHMILVRFIISSALPHQVSSSLPSLLSAYSDKALKYLFHIIALGRFWPVAEKQLVYNWLGKTNVVVVFHVALAIYLFLATFRRKVASCFRIIAFLLPIIFLLLAIVSPRQFPDLGWVVFDRYLYFALPFVYLVIALAITTKKSYRWSLVFFFAFSMINLWLLWKVNTRWKESNNLVQHLLESFPVDDSKVTLLLNLPENYDGIQMIGSNRTSAMKTAYNAKHDKKIQGNVYDIASFNMNTMKDGAHVKVVNDSMLHVTMNQWGTWWWFYYIGASSFENEWYKLDLKDPGHWYELTLKMPQHHYQLLFVNEQNWRTVDMNKKDSDQY
ncbi:MAG TPA: hypothetical protein PL009_07235 [Flavipsychrobacter sp.]|nr:hypothetical protein [Flavipsychrobacter sp.]